MNSGIVDTVCSVRMVEGRYGMRVVDSSEVKGRKGNGISVRRHG